MGACECKEDGAAGSEGPPTSTDETVAAGVPDAEVTVPVTLAANPEVSAVDSAQIQATPLEPEVSAVADPAHAVLEKFSEFRREGKDGELASLFAEDVKWMSLYSETICGCAEVVKWLDEQREGGRRNILEGPFQSQPGTNKFTRDLKITFPNGATHEVKQEISMVDGRITQIEILPASDEHALVLSFAAARREGNIDKALQIMSSSIIWKTWDGQEIVGRDNVMKIMMRQVSSKEIRRGIADYEQLPEVPAGGGAYFSRALEVEQMNGAKTRTTTTLLVKSIDNVCTIVEVSVQNEEALINGEWTKSSVSSDRLQEGRKQSRCSMM